MVCVQITYFNYIFNWKLLFIRFESWLRYERLVAFFIYYPEGSSGLDTVLQETTQLVTVKSPDLKSKL